MSIHMSQTIPKLDLLIKMMKMTTADNDGVALVAIRKANELLASMRADWDALLRSRVTIVADPFQSISTPTPCANPVHARAHAPQRPQPAAAPPPRPQPTPQYAARPSTPQTRQPSTRRNRFSGSCFGCGCYIANPGDGWLDIHSTKYIILCNHCNNISTPLGTRPAKPQRPKIDDILNI